VRITNSNAHSEGVQGHTISWWQTKNASSAKIRLKTMTKLLLLVALLTLVPTVRAQQLGLIANPDGLKTINLTGVVRPSRRRADALN
jgi:hypothetical protein